ncbi:helix-turn-helix domain-containing protein [Pedobacter ginsengisoli]|uniref:helix-turn-helix domain-containing protein n=1 Tax=Pedobacter ginsengisoli TaxID=363852 RepID=UPI002550FE35|nr:helix-turn-helix domain-containing protein [Pedobacter ginsengisoli]
MERLIEIVLRIETMIREVFEEWKNKNSTLMIPAVVPLKEKWLSTSEVKFLLDRKERMLYEYVKQGKLIARKRGGVNVYLEESVNRFLNGNEP